MRKTSAADGAARTLAGGSEERPHANSEEAGGAERAPNGEPSPRRPPAVYEAFDYGAGARVPLPRATAPRAYLATVLARRRTRRAFGRVEPDALSALLWFTARTLETDASAPPGTRGVWEHRGTPSAGGRHPIDVWVCRAPGDWPGPDGASADVGGAAGGRRTLWRYDPLSHALVALRPADVVAQTAQAALDALPARVVEDGRGVDEATVLWHAAQFGRTAAAYVNPDTLVWRDAGCLVAMTALVAASLDLACCPLGATGEPYVSRVAGATAGEVRGVGGCVIGRELSPRVDNARG